MSLKQPIICSLALVLCLFVQVSMQAAPFPQAVIAEMASREARYHHYLWHNVRDNWNFFTPEVQQELTRLGWAAPRPSRGRDANGNLIAITDNDCGEDFLYMHRQMIKRVNDIVAQTNDPYGPITSWKTLPAPGDAEWPVPAAYTIPGASSTSSTINARKSVAFYNNTLKPMEDFFYNKTELRNMTLGQLGTRLENTVHAYLHLRFSSASTYGYRPGSSGTIPSINTKWDDPRYDWLGDTYASHVNPVFWKLHGWINDRIVDWARANGLSIITWKGTWQGGPMSTIAEAIGTATAAKLSSTPMGKSALRTSTAKAAAIPVDPVTVEDLETGEVTTTGMNHMGHMSASSDPTFLDETMGEVLRIFANGGVQEASFADDVKVDFEVPKPAITKTSEVKKTKKTCKAKKI